MSAPKHVYSLQDSPHQRFLMGDKRLKIGEATSERATTAPSGQRPGTLLTILQCTGCTRSNTPIGFEADTVSGKVIADHHAVQAL